MTVEEIKAAIEAGERVYWISPVYEVKKNMSSYDIVCSINEYRIGLTHMDEVTLNGDPDEFYIGEKG